MGSYDILINALLERGFDDYDTYETLDTADEDVPNVSDKKEYKTHGYLNTQEDIVNPTIIIPQRKRKLLTEPPSVDISNIKKDAEIDDEDDDYETVQELKRIIKEQLRSKEERNAQDLANADPNLQPEMDPNMMAGQDPNAMTQDPNVMAGQDPYAMGGTLMPGTPSDISGATFGAGEPKSAQQLGRIYELKKIYSRLLSVEQHLSFSADTVFLKLRNLVSEAIELFEFLISNIDAFKDRIDSIIIVYYEFLKTIYLILQRYYDMKEEESKDIEK